MTRQLRRGPAQHGLVLANGGVVTYQHAICLSSRSRRDDSAYPDANPLPEVITDVAVPVVDKCAEGEAVIEVSFSLFFPPLSPSNSASELGLVGFWVEVEQN